MAILANLVMLSTTVGVLVSFSMILMRTNSFIDTRVSLYFFSFHFWRNNMITYTKSVQTTTSRWETAGLQCLQHASRGSRQRGQAVA